MKFSSIAIFAFLSSAHASNDENVGMRGLKKKNKKKKNKCKNVVEDTLLCDGNDPSFDSDVNMLGDFECREERNDFYLSNGATWDCHGHAILSRLDEDDFAFMIGAGGATIKNCIFMNFYEGIVFDRTANEEISLTVEDCTFINFGNGGDAVRARYGSSSYPDYSVDVKISNSAFVGFDAKVLSADAPGTYSIDNCIMTGGYDDTNTNRAAIDGGSDATLITVTNTLIAGFGTAFDVNCPISVSDSKLLKNTEGINSSSDVTLSNVDITFSADRGVEAVPDDSPAELDFEDVTVCESGNEDIALLESDFDPFVFEDVSCSSSTGPTCDDACTHISQIGICSD